MNRYCLIGHPVAHSKSPQFQEAGFRALNIDARYDLLDVLPEDLFQAFSQLRQTHAGWNVTIPHKEAVLSLVDTLSPEAACLGSVNTIVNEHGQLTGYSTDGYGLEKALLDSFGFGFENHRICFLGTGGAAHAAAVYAALHGASQLLLVNRTVERARRLSQNIQAVGGHAHVLPLQDTDAIEEALKDMDLLIQCTSLGLRPDDPLPLPIKCLPPKLPVMDMIYGTSRFRSLAAAAGHPTADGRLMLLHQGCRSFELWTGREAPIDAMRQALDHACSVP